MDHFLSKSRDEGHESVSAPAPSVGLQSSESLQPHRCSRPKTDFVRPIVNVASLTFLLTWMTLIATSIAHPHQSFNSTNIRYSNSSGATLRNFTEDDDKGHAAFKRNAAHVNRTQSLILKPEHFTIPIGGVIHLFPRYGYFHLSMKVIAKTDKVGQTNSSSNAQTSSTTHSLPSNESWIFLEPINNVLEPTTFRIEESTISSNDSHSLPFHNLFHIDLCEDIRELMEAYFKNFSVEGLDKPWQAFSGGWRVPSIARYFGIDQAYVEGDYRYILVKVLLVRGSGTVIPMLNTTVASTYHTNFQRFQPNNDLSTYEFFKVVGTHYIHAYIVGNAVYQVFVYDPDGFQNVKKRLFYDGIRDQSNSAFMEKLPEVLSIWVKHIGRVFVLSSTPEVLETVRKALAMSSAQAGSTSSLFKLHNNSKLVHEIEQVLAGQPNAVLGIDLRGIHFLFKDPIQRAGFEKALKHQMQLWEINFQY